MASNVKLPLPSPHPTQKFRPMPVSTVWDELTDADFPARPPSAPSNIETISLWGPRYPGQKLHPESPDLMSPIDEDPSPVISTEPDHPEIWDRVVTLCDLLRALIERLPPPDEEPTGNPHGPISSRHILEYGDSFIQSLEPVRPLTPNKLADFALAKTPELATHVRQLEHRFDDLERVLDYVPRVFEQVTPEDCGAAMKEVEAIMVCLGVGL